MHTIQVTVKSQHGIHARPSAMIVEYVRCHKSTVTIENPKNNKKVTADSILSMLSIDTDCGELVIIKGYGPDEEEVVEYIGKIITEYDI
jgi:phosphotransferase system HPr (HPr) family protein